MPKHPDIIHNLTKIVGSKQIITDKFDMLPYVHEERGLAQGEADVVLRPLNTGQVSSIMKYCYKQKLPVIPVGGATGLVGGTLANGGIILATDSLNKILNVDQLDNTMTVEAGCILADLQKAAKEKNCLFPLSLGAEGSCRIGGNLATNAGGINVLRYGSARDLVLGLEVVLPDGQIWNGLNGLRKDNTGYDLKHLYIGSEGTLGVITKATLKLYPMPRMTITVLLGLPKLDAVIQLFDEIRTFCGNSLSAFELIPALGIELGAKHIQGIRDPFQEKFPYYTLIELTSSRETSNLREDIERVLENSLEKGLITDAVFAVNESQRKSLWRIREEIPAAQTLEGGSIKHDISVPVSKTVDFILKANKRVSAELPAIRPCPFGHIGDGNIHYNLSQPPAMNKNDFMNYSTKFNRIIHDLVAEMDGSISAEHGIGSFKRNELVRYSSETKISIMRQIKQTLDPYNIMNPGKIFE